MSLHAWSDPVCIHPVFCLHQIILDCCIIFAVLECGNLIQLTLGMTGSICFKVSRTFPLLSRNSNSTPFSGSPDDLSVLLRMTFPLAVSSFITTFWISPVSFTSNVTSDVRRYPFGACSSRKVYLPIGSFQYSVPPLWKSSSLLPDRPYQESLVLHQESLYLL